MGEFAGRQFRGVDLFDEQAAAALHRFEIDAKALHAREQQAEFFVEHEQRRLLAARDRGDDENDGGQRFAGARGAQDQRARSRLDAAAEQLVEFGNAARHLVRTKLLRYSDATSRGKTFSPPVVMVTS